MQLSRLARRLDFQCRFAVWRDWAEATLRDFSRLGYGSKNGVGTGKLTAPEPDAAVR